MDERSGSPARMQVDWDAPITMDDGVVLRADVFRPTGAGKHPVILSYGPYAKGLSFQEGYKGNWARLTKAAPEVLEGSSNKYQNWELVDPEKWVPDGYACVRVDSRGAGRSPGHLDVWSPREAQDLYQCVEWAGTQPWSNGKVGINGISYYAMNQWQVAALNPPHLAALCIWEGSSDYYRELCRHGGILSDFLSSWYPRQVASVQHGVGERGARSAVTGELVAGPPTLSEEELAKKRADIPGEAMRRRLLDDYYTARTAEFAQHRGAAAVGRQLGRHGPAPARQFRRLAARRLQAEMAGGARRYPLHAFLQQLWRDAAEAVLRPFPQGRGHRLGAAAARCRSTSAIPARNSCCAAENEWPLARTQWTKYFLQPEGLAMGTEAPVSETTLSYETTGDGVTFRTPPMTRPLEITGPVAAKLWLSSQTVDADVFLVLRVFDPAGKEVVFIGSNDPRVPVGLGWLRASHRKLDPRQTLPYRPWHTHDEEWPLTPGEPVELDIEIWPTSIVVPPGYRSRSLCAARTMSMTAPMRGSPMRPIR